MQKFLMRAAFVAAFGVVLGLTSAAHAADKGGPVYIPPSVEDVYTPKVTAYKTGCYVAGSVGMTIADVSIAGVSFADESATYGIGGGCDMVNKALVLGALASANFNDSSDAAYQLGLRAGVLLSPHVLAYATGGWALTDAGTNFDGWYVGGGIEFLVNDHLFVGGEYTADLYKSETIGGLSVDPTAHHVKARIGWRF